ncbi:phosphoribosyltransferase family protein [Brumimicrobium aurantiacum]|uniref:Phosphoribosyltransferase n=1 Tax=Brumimicrobium aurantiacum TaxID=1737063 RepID=A0A3E1F049_9FLAO|nr:phosphoribosyltransferase family protein [Brumimicrobium aurantiacum]RFC55178.1 phosphoribosyltransferase [Brumimicrobium aurantiacum]
MKTLVLNNRQIQQKLDRIAYQIVENNFDEEQLYLVGIRGNGLEIAKEIAQRLEDIGQQKIEVCELSIDKKKPLDHKITTNIPLENFDQNTIILIDDVINSGRTMQYALLKLLERPTKKVKTVALVDRKHRSFPIRCDYVGLTLSTTLQDRIEVDLEGEKNAYLI